MRVKQTVSSLLLRFITISRPLGLGIHASSDPVGSMTLHASHVHGDSRPNSREHQFPESLAMMPYAPDSIRKKEKNMADAPCSS